MSVIQKLQKQSLGVKKLIFWTAMVFAAFLTFFWWLNLAQKNLSQMQIETPSKESSFPAVDLPSIPIIGDETMQQ